MFPAELPAEITILILTHIPLSSLCVLNRLNKAWHYFIAHNSSAIYRNAAYLERYVLSPEILLESLAPRGAGMEREALHSSRVIRGMADWKELCRRRKMIERAWSGFAPSCVQSSPRTLPSPLPPNAPESSHYRRVHRIKVDEKAGIIITTTELGGLVVRDLEKDLMLWELPIWYVPTHAHLEYGEGYMIFDRADGNKEVWRRTVDIEADATYQRPSSSDHRQQHVASYMRTLRGTAAVSADQRNAEFTPHAVLQMPETTRAFRFVYPTLLVASLERAYLWDVRTGELVQIIADIQVVRPIEIQYEEGSDSHDSEDQNFAYGALSTGPEEVPVDPDLPQLNISSNFPAQDRDDYGSDDDDVDMDDDTNTTENSMPQYTGLIRYVEVSSRHVFIVGRYLLRVFSRATGKCVLDIPSTLPRYGSCKWDVASHASLSADADNRQNSALDSYEAAQTEGRELVRVPLSFTYEECRKPERLLIDQLVAVHVSSDGRHLVAMLSGSRLVILHHFEDILSRHSVPKHSQRPRSRRNARAEARHAQEARKKDLFYHTLDVQLGAPRASSSVYLAYEHGQIGVVTTNAVYIVTPTVPPPPSQSPMFASGAVPGLTVARLPYFANPSWLGAVSCLMMSDTGLYLNWNPTAHVSADQWADWETDFEDELEEYETNEADRYHLLPNGDMFVASIPRELEISEVSTVFSVDFLGREQTSVENIHLFES